VVLGGVAQATAATILLCASAPPPLPRWHLRAQRDIAGFGMPAALAGLVHVLYTNVDYAILAARLSAYQTGIYWRAFNLGVLYQDKLGNVMIQMAFPVYSRTESRDELRELHERATRILTLAIFPLLASLIVLAPVLIPFVFGPAWEPAVVPTQILALAGMIAVALTGYAQVMLAVGRPDVLLRFNAGMLVVYAGAVMLASTHGLVVVACTVVAVYVAILAGVYLLMLGPQIGLRLRRLARQAAPACTGSVVLVAAGLPARMSIESSGVPAPLTIALAGLIGAGAYVVVIRLLFAPAWRDLLSLAGRVIPRSRRRVSRPVAAVAVPADGGGS
jgi:O-antigen/teichoic acid export membrane protein